MRSAPFEALRYVAAAGLIVAVFAGLVLAFGGSAPDEASSEVDSAVMIDLPASEASSRPRSDATEGPEQQAVAAAEAAPDAPPPKPEEIKPEEEKPTQDKPTQDKPSDEKSPEVVKPVEPAPAELPPPAADPVPKPETVEKPVERPQPPAAPSPAQVEMAPSGAEVPVATKKDEGDEGRPRPSGRVITLWQRSLMKRLETSRRQLSASRYAGGTVTVAFVIGDRGELVSERVAKSSGSQAMDAAAMLLVRRAAPFPTPPVGSRDNDLSFTVPVRFR